jgi:hypothetical protein
VGWTCGTNGRGEKSVQGFGGKARRKQRTRKTEACMGEWEWSGYEGHSLGGCAVDSPMAGCREHGYEPSGSGTTQLVI